MKKAFLPCMFAPDEIGELTQAFKMFHIELFLKLGERTGERASDLLLQLI